jgi:hypothetical protein
MALDAYRQRESGSPRIPYITRPNATSVDGTTIASNVKNTAACGIGGATPG